MRRHRGPRSSRRAASAVGASAGALGVAALVAAVQATGASAVGGVSASAGDAVAPAASEAPWVAGPLEVPSIGVEAPGFERAYEALDEASSATPLSTPAAAPVDTSTAPATSSRPEAPAVIAAVPTPDAPARATPSTDPTPTDEEPAPSTSDPALTTSEPAPSTDQPLPSTEQPPTTTAPPTTTEPPPPTTEPPPPTEEPPPPTEQPPVEEPPVDVDLALGEALAATDPATGEVVATVTVDAVTVDQACTAEGSTPAENGHLVGLQVRVTSGPAAPADLAVDAASFAFVAADGTIPATVATAAATGCLTAAEAFPAGPLAAGQEYVGIVVIDVPGTSGTATYRPAPDAAGGRWSF